MKVSDYDYNLPDDLIAQTPVTPRDSSKMLILDKEQGKIQDKFFYNILDDLTENDVLVLNKTKVINARLKGISDSGRDIEVFLLKELEVGVWECLVFPGKKLKPGRKVFFKKKEIKSKSFEKNINGAEKPENFILKGEIIEKTAEGRIIKFDKSGLDFLTAIDEVGQMPLPPYIKQKLENSERYQTVFSETFGSVAAPTASLHFTEELLQKIKEKGVKIEKVLLHIGLGTFNTIKTDEILDHNMHKEYIEIDEKVASRLNNYKLEGKRIISVGTTTVRVLESFSNEKGEISYGSKDTQIFIYPGYKWKFVDSLITNFHLPKSTLLMLVSSIAGKKNIEKAYKYAMKKKYRFFSFGDSMWIR